MCQADSMKQVLLVIVLGESLCYSSVREQALWSLQDLIIYVFASDTAKLCSKIKASLVTVILSAACGMYIFTPNLSI